MKTKVPEEFSYTIGGNSMTSGAKLFALKKAIDKGMLSKEYALQASFQGMEQKVVGWIRSHKPITLETLTAEIRSDTKFLEQMERIDIHISDYEEMARHFAKPETIKTIEDKLEAGKKLKTGRNEPCPCGSGKKYKRCCGR